MPISAYPVFEHLAGGNTGAADSQLAHPKLPTQTQPTDTNMASKANLKSSGREAALARRRALSNRGKQGQRKTAPERTRGVPAKAAASAPAPQPAAAAPQPAPRAASTPAASMSAAPRQAPARRATAASPSPSQSSRALARQRRAALAQAGRKAVRSKDRVRTPGEMAAAASAPAEKSGGCKCGCKGERQEAAKRDLDLSQFAHQPGAPRQSASLGNGNGKSTRNKRADAALGVKPAGRMLSLARRQALSGRGKAASNTPKSVASLARQANPKLSGRELAQKVRAARASNGGAGEPKSQPSGRVRPTRTGALAGAADQPWKVGVTETSHGQRITGTRVGRSAKATGDEPSTCRTVTGTEYLGAEIFREFCQTEPQPGIDKVRITATSHGNRVTGNEVGRSPRVTGDEPGTCKNITGTEYLAPSQYEAFCQTKPEPGPRRIGFGESAGGRPVSGNMVGRSGKVTGDELGSEIRPTGTQYTSPSEIGKELMARDEQVPPKVGTSVTLSGGTVTGTRVGRSERVTGDEPGSCRNVTGDEYIDLNQYQIFCQTKPQPEPPKVGQSTTNKGHRISGTQTGRSGRVTGDEPGTCKAVTGTPYAGLEQADSWCEPSQKREIQARTRQLAATPGPRMTGIQPGIDPARGGKLTGAAKGACEPLTGTPYVGADQYAAACAAEGQGNGALPGHSDFPQLIDATDSAGAQLGGRAAEAPWQRFSVQSPARAAAQAKQHGPVTGINYESGGHITGPFGMASGKITGTEQFRFDSKRPRPDLLKPAPMAPGAAAGSGDDPIAEGAAAATLRVTGEGQSAGGKVTGDDWERGDRVTGTEGRSARRRNPTRPGPMGAMPLVERKRNEEVPQPTSPVTGSVGSTERGALVTYSGGARG
jgi:hypothetical protein